MKNSRDKIPPDIKRAVRKRCGYGCILCGNPFFEYDHIVEYNLVKRHEEENLTLLCLDHHGRKTRGLLPTSTIRSANAEPYAIKHPEALREMLYFKKESAVIKIATNSIRVSMSEGRMIIPFILYKRIPFYFRVENGNLLLNGEFHDKDGNRLVHIEENEIQYLRQDYDIEKVGSKIIIRKEKRDIIFCVNVNPEDAIIDIEVAIFIYGGISICLEKNELKITSAQKDAIVTKDRYVDCSGFDSRSGFDSVAYSILSPFCVGKLLNLEEF